VVRGGEVGTMRMTMADGKMHMQASKVSMDSLADMLSRFVDRPVVNMTELKGNYQVTLELSMEDLRILAQAQGMMVPGPGRGAGGDGAASPADLASEPSGGSIFQAVQELGLKLDARKAPVETLIIDHVEKTPAEN
jgi:uncharacterized protein (TIGR03435 family)